MPLLVRTISMTRRASALFWQGVRTLVFLLGVVSALGVVTMMGTTCLDVILRAFGRPLLGAFDIVKLAGAVTIACGLPYTTAVKGHVAIEFFFQKLSRRGRIVVDTVTRLLCMNLLGFLSWHSFKYGATLKRAGQVTDTVQIPLFWVPHVIGVSCAIVVLVVFYNLLHPGREMIKP